MIESKAFADWQPLEAAGEFSALVAVTGNVDRVGDRILPGAFRSSLAALEVSGKTWPVVFAHQWHDPLMHLGHVLEARETDRGLEVRGLLDLDHAPAARVYKAMHAGAIGQFSFAFEVKDAAEVTESGATIREIRDLEVFEVGPCLVGMNPETELLAVKALSAKAGRVLSKETAARLRAIAGELLAFVDGYETEGPAETGKAAGVLPATAAALTRARALWAWRGRWAE